MGGIVSKYVFFPPTPPLYSPDDVTTYIPSSAGNVAACFIKNPSSDRLVIYVHGNAEDLIGSIRNGPVYSRHWNVSWLGFDYSGYGYSEGQCSIDNAMENTRAVVAYAINTLGYRPEKIVIYGRSLGTAFSVAMAMEQSQTAPFAGVMLHSPLMSAFHVALKRTLPGDQLCSFKKIGEIESPMYIFHGTHDSVIPVQHGMTLFDLATYPYDSWWPEGAGHNDIEAMYGPEYNTRIQAFLQFVFQGDVKEQLRRRQEKKPSSTSFSFSDSSTSKT